MTDSLPGLPATRVLVPLDGSEQSDKALAYVAMMAQDMSLHVKLLRCYEPPAAIYALSGLGLPVDSLGAERLGERLAADLEKKRSRLDAIPCEALVECVEAASGIIDQAESVDLVVMSSHGRGVLGRWLLGSVTTKVARACAKPVLVLPRQDGPPRLQTIMVCLDGSVSAEAGLREAIKLARAFGAALVAYRSVPVVYPGLEIEDNVREAERYLESVVVNHSDARIRTVVRQTDGRSGIVEMAQELKADLIVLGRRGSGTFSRWIMGSVAEHVLHHATCPVLVVH